ncbi:MAG: MFS transporter [Ardenticatenales bacterium]|nr:MFS transporter [Ardenticatenales bacterium]
MLTHLVPVFLAETLGARTAVVGLIEGLAETTASLTKLYSGRLSDRWGRRKGLTASGYGVAAAALPVLFAAATWPVVLSARLLDRLGKGIRTAPRDALLADAVTPETRGRAFGLHRAADSAGAFVGLVMAMAIVQRAGIGALPLDAATFRTIVGWAVVPGVLAVVVIVVGVREVVAVPRRDLTLRPPPEPHRTGGAAGTPVNRLGEEEDAWRGAVESGQSRVVEGRFARFLVVTVLFTLANASDAFLVLRARSLGASLVEVLALLALFNLVYASLSTWAGGLSDRVPRRRLIVAGWLIYAAVYLGFAFADAPGWLWLLYGAYGIYYALTDGVAKAIVADLVPSARRGAAYGAYHAAVGLTALPASVLAGVLWQGVGAWGGLGPRAPFLVGAGLAVGAAGLMAGWVGRVSATDRAAAREKGPRGD